MINYKCLHIYFISNNNFYLELSIYTLLVVDSNLGPDHIAGPKALDPSPL